MEAIREALEALPVGIVFAEADPGRPARVTKSNAMFARLVGVNVEPGTPYDELPYALFLPDRLTRLEPEACPVATAARTGEPVPERELHLRRPSGEWRVLAVSAAPLDRPAGDSTGRAAGVVLDRTDQRRAEDDISRRGQLLRLVVDSSPTPVFVKNRRSEILFANVAALRAFGKELAEVVGRSTRELFADGPRGEQAERNDRRVIERGESEVFEEPFSAPDGERVYLTSKAPYRDSSGQIIGVVGVSQDVTERRRAEDLARQNQKLEGIGRLAGGVAHDFNNLLTVILCGLEEQEEALAAGGAVTRESVDQLQTAAEHARELTQRLLTFAGRGVVNPETLDLGALFTVLEPALRRTLGERVRLEVERGRDLWPVRCDPAQMKRVLLDLAANARDAMPGGGTLTLSAANVPGSSDGSGGASDQVRLRVGDSGAGMSPEVKEHLFEPFFTTKDGAPGSGLGLATVYGIVRQAGGQVRVDSAPGRGTTVELLLPRAASAPAEGPVRRDGARRGEETVLLVEDDPGVRDVALRALRSGGYRVIAASGAAEAVEAFRVGEQRPGLLVTDVMMPTTSGRVLAESLRKEHPGLPVLFLSGHSSEVLEPEGVLEPGVSFLAKPFTPSALLSRVRSVLDTCC